MSGASYSLIVSERVCAEFEHTRGLRKDFREVCLLETSTLTIQPQRSLLLQSH